MEAPTRGVAGRTVTRKRLAVLTTGRQDWGILRSTCRAIAGAPELELCLLAGGMHASAMYGSTQELLVQEGMTPAEVLRWIPDEGLPTAHAQAAGALQQVGDALVRQRPDALVLAGDRLETAAAALAATLGQVPIVHLHGGEESEGAFDNSLRHAITKLSHLHLVSHPVHARRVVAMGEDPATVHVVGAPGLDNARRSDLPDRAELEASLGITLTPPVVLVTLHPATLGGDPATEAAAVVAAMGQLDATYVITMPNSDPGSEIVATALRAFATGPRRRLVESLGERRFWGLLLLLGREGGAMLGNSSSALIEAPVARVPAVNVGDRQKGRLRGANVLDVPAEAGAIVTSLRRALSTQGRPPTEVDSPFGDGRAAERIVAILCSWTPPKPPRKAGPRITP